MLIYVLYVQQGIYLISSRMKKIWRVVSKDSSARGVDRNVSDADNEDSRVRKWFCAIHYLIVILVSQCGQMTGTVVPYVPYVPHLPLVAVANPLDLLGAIVLDSMHLLRVVLPQSFELLALVLLDVVEHLVDLLRSRRHPHASTAQTPLDASAPARNS